MPGPEVLETGPKALRTEIRSVLDRTSGPWATILLPVEPAPNPGEQNRARLEGALDRLRSEAAAECLANADALPLPDRADDVAPIRRLGRDGVAGIALFLGPDASLARRLPFAPTSLQEIDCRAHIRPLWRQLEPVGEHLVLALSAGGGALYRAWRHGVEPVPLDQGPATLLQALRRDENGEPEDTADDTGGPPEALSKPATQYAQEVGLSSEAFTEKLVQYFRSLDTEVRRYVREEMDVARSPPLVLAGVEEFRELYRRASVYRPLLDDAIEESLIDPATGTWDGEALRSRSWPIAKAYSDRERQEALSTVHGAPERALVSVESVLLSALRGRVETLFVSETLTAWGQYDPSRCRVTVHRRRQAGDTELMNAATVATLRSGGTVYVSDAQAIPESPSIAALLRS